MVGKLGFPLSLAGFNKAFQLEWIADFDSRCGTKELRNFSNISFFLSISNSIKETLGKVLKAGGSWLLLQD